MLKSSLFIIVLLILSCTEPQDINDSTTELDVKTEKHIEYHANGKVKLKGDLVKGIRQNKWVSFYENGNNWSESNYLFGKKDGIYKLFYPNGTLKVHGVYENDKKKGVWFFYNENGQFEKEIDFNKEDDND